jgi:hypothetical protein
VLAKFSAGPFDSVACFLKKIHAQIYITDTPHCYKITSTIPLTSTLPMVNLWFNSKSQNTWICVHYMSEWNSFLSTYFALADHPENTLALCTAQECTLIYQIIVYLGMLLKISTLLPDTYASATTHNAPLKLDHLNNHQVYGSPKRLV